MQSEGYISAVHGDVVEIVFSEERPAINDALVVSKPDTGKNYERDV
jgi:F0F1-type ATP synthase beta subunit